MPALLSNSTSLVGNQYSSCDSGFATLPGSFEHTGKGDTTLDIKELRRRQRNAAEPLKHNPAQCPLLTLTKARLAVGLAHEKRSSICTH